jgi:hypothetical protein
VTLATRVAHPLPASGCNHTICAGSAQRDLRASAWPLAAPRRAVCLGAP